MTVKAILLSAMITLFGTTILQAQDLGANLLPPVAFSMQTPVEVGLPGQGDSVTSHPKRQLLPGKISFLEKWLWDENGMFRKIGIAGPLTPESRKTELAARRTMLTLVQNGDSLDVAGKLTFHGITRDILIKSAPTWSESRLRVDGDFAISLTDFKIERPSLLFIPVEDTLRFSFVAVFGTQ
jgi:hypothetical protein